MSETTTDITCSRCNRTAPPAQKITYGGKLGAQIRAHVCNDCWSEWQNMEVIVINELRLDFMDPKSVDKLTKHLQEFFSLPASSSAPSDS